MMNNLGQDPYRKPNPPDLIRNINDSYTEKDYEKQKFLDNENNCKLNNNEISLKAQEPDVSNLERKSPSLTKKRKIKRGFCYVAWVLCAPCMLFGYCFREQPDPDDVEEETRDDPCLPWAYDVHYRRPGVDDK